MHFPIEHGDIPASYVILYQEGIMENGSQAHQAGVCYFHDLINDYYTIEHPLTQRSVSGLVGWWLVITWLLPGSSFPIGSTYGIFKYLHLCSIFMVNVYR